jgi:acetyl esterase/lipase
MLRRGHDVRATRGALLLAALFAALLALAPRSPGIGETLPRSATAAAAEVGVVDRVGVVESAEATELRVLADPVAGELHLPTERSGPVPAVVVLNGADGYDLNSNPDGLRGLAQHLAAQGFVTLRLCYFGCAGRPTELRRIPLEYVLAAVEYLRALPEVDAANVSVWGWSRGGELALLTGAHGPEVRSVIALYGAPWAFNGSGSLAAVSDCAWTHGGACLPYMMRMYEFVQIEGLLGVSGG